MEHSGTIAVSREDADNATPIDTGVLREGVLLNPHVFRSIDRRAKRADDFSASAIAIRVQDAAATVRRLTAQRETPIGVAVEARAQRCESLDLARCPISQNLYQGAIAQPSARAERIAGMQIRPAVGPEACR